MTVLHDDDWWEPTYLSSLVAVLDADPEVGLACCATVLDDEHGRTTPWPFPLGAGRHDGVLETLLREDWFLLLNATMWRREVWAGPARQWSELCCADLQLFLSAADAGWALYYLPTPLAHWAQHRGQSGAERGVGPRVGSGKRRSRLLGRVARRTTGGPGRALQRATGALAPPASPGPCCWRDEALRRVSPSKAALALARESDLVPTDLPGLRRLSFASHLPPFAVRTGVGLKRVGMAQLMPVASHQITARRLGVRPLSGAKHVGWSVMRIAVVNALTPA